SSRERTSAIWKRFCWPTKERGAKGDSISPSARLLPPPHHRCESADHDEREDRDDDRTRVEACGDSRFDGPDALFPNDRRAPAPFEIAGGRRRRDDSELGPWPHVRAERGREVALSVRRSGCGRDAPAKADDLEAHGRSRDWRAAGRHRDGDRRLPGLRRDRDRDEERDRGGDPRETRDDAGPPRRHGRSHPGRGVPQTRVPVRAHRLPDLETPPDSTVGIVTTPAVAGRAIE